MTHMLRRQSRLLRVSFLTIWVTRVTTVLSAACGGGSSDPDVSAQQPVSLAPSGATSSGAAPGAATRAGFGAPNAATTATASGGPGAAPAGVNAGTSASTVGASMGSAGTMNAIGSAGASAMTGSAGAFGMAADPTLASSTAGSAAAKTTEPAMGVAGSSAPRSTDPSAEPMGPLFPANGSQSACVDAALRLRFDDKPSLGSGKISVYEMGSSGQPVTSVDVSSGQMRVNVGGTDLVFLKPVLVVEHEVIVSLPARLEYGKSYYVTVDAGAIRGSGGASVSRESDWQFTTRAGPAADPSQLRVALDGTGDFCSVQAALEAASPGATISVGEGYYHELIHVSGKSALTLRGDDRKHSVVLGINNDNTNGGTAKRALVNIEKSSDITIERLTIHNLTQQGGSQAEALRLQDCDRCVVRDADILSLQDTLLWSGRIYAKDCYIAGNVDFVWGKGAVYFDSCEIKTVGRKGYIVQSRNEVGGQGYVFVDSKITAESGISGIVLARIDASVYPGSHVAYINCEMGNHIAPEGWTVTGGGGGSLRFWEYQSTDASGRPLDVSRRHPSSRQISADQAAMMRDPANVLGGWNPTQ